MNIVMWNIHKRQKNKIESQQTDTHLFLNEK